MMAVLKAFRIAFLIFSFIYICCLLPLASGNSSNNENKCMEKCSEQTSYCLENQNSLYIDLYYDSGTKLEPDTGFVLSMCKARALFKNVTFSFFVGVQVKKNDIGDLECENVDAANKDCTWYIRDACAFKLLDETQFANYVCCNYDLEIGFTTALECLSQQQRDKSGPFSSCEKKNQNSKPVEVLLKNSEIARSTYPDEQCFPLLAFNGISDKCTRTAFYNDPVKVICAMLAEGVEEACKT